MLSRKKTGDPEWDPEFEPLMKLLLSKKGIKSKSASEIGRKKVDYFRGRDFKKFVTSSDEIMKKKCSAALKATLEGETPVSDKDVEVLGTELIQRNFCYRAMYQPLNASKADSGKPKKWPDRVVRCPKQNFDCDGYYVITYEGGKGWQNFLLACIIAAVLLACMFPVWPMWAKIGIWYLSVIFLSLYFGVLIIRLVVYVLFWIVGFDFWVFPNINDEYCGFLDSFQPFYSWEKRKDDWLTLLVRFGSLAIVAAAAEQISQTMSLNDVQDFIQSSYTDVLDWGVEKLMALPGSDRQALPSLESLEKSLGEDEKAATEGAETAASADTITTEEDDAEDGDEINVDAASTQE